MINYKDGVIRDRSQIIGNVKDSVIREDRFFAGTGSGSVVGNNRDYKIESMGRGARGSDGCRV